LSTSAFVSSHHFLLALFSLAPFRCVSRQPLALATRWKVANLDHTPPYSFFIFVILGYFRPIRTLLFSVLPLVLSS
jgi:hypothetical protein